MKSVYRLILFCLLSVSALWGYSGAKAEESATDRPSAILIRNVNIFDGKGDDLIMGRDVLIQGNKIQKISGSIPKPANARVIDGAGRTLMPGLIEAHGHLMTNASVEKMMATMYWDENAARMVDRAGHYLEFGFTTVRDVAGWVFGIKHAIDDGTIPGPRLYASGAGISQTVGHGDVRLPFQKNPYLGRFPSNANPQNGNVQYLGHLTLADGVPEVQKAARENLAAGAAFIKLMAGGGIASFDDPLQAIQYTKEELAAAQVEAEHYGTYVTVHAHMDRAINNAFDAGIRHFEHATIMNDKTMEKLGKAGAYICPQAYLFLQKPEENPSWTNDIQRKKAQLAYEGVENVLKKASKYGIKVLWGTDVIGPANVFENMVLEWKYRAPYFGNAEQLKQATSLNAEVLALTTFRNPYPEAPLGVIEEGAYADILLINGNPVEDIMIMTEPRKYFDLIMKDGKIYKNKINGVVTSSRGDHRNYRNGLSDWRP